MNKNIEVEVIDKNEESGEVLVNQDGNETSYMVVAPASMKFVKPGKATIGFDQENNINYIRSASGFKPNPNRGYNNQNGGGFKKSFPSQGFKKPFTPGNQLKEYHYNSQVQAVQGVSLKEFEETYNVLSKVNWVTASQVFPTEVSDLTFVKVQINPDKSYTGKEVLALLNTIKPVIHYDALIYLKVKKEGVREPSEDGEVEF